MQRSKCSKKQKLKPCNNIFWPKLYIIDLLWCCAPADLEGYGYLCDIYAFQVTTQKSLGLDLVGWPWSWECTTNYTIFCKNGVVTTVEQKKQCDELFHLIECNRAEVSSQFKLKNYEVMQHKVHETIAKNVKLNFYWHLTQYFSY